MTTNILPFRPAAPAGLIQLAASGVAFDLHVAAVDRRRKTATYELILANQSVGAVSGRLFGTDRTTHEHTFGALEVAARSLGRSLFTVPLASWRTADERVFMEVVGDGLHLLAAAHPPAIPKRGNRISLPTILAASAAGAFLLAAALAMLGAARPSIAELGAPQHVYPGLVTAYYALRGRSVATYRVSTSSGAPLAAGRLDPTGGSVAITVPARVTGQDVRLTVDARGPFGHDARTIAFHVEPAPVGAAAPAQIRALTAHREAYGSGESVLVSYSASADGGVVRIVDERGKAIGSAPFTHVGTSRIPLLGDTHAQWLRAELQVARGKSRAEASVEMPAQADGDLKAANLVAAALSAENAPGLGADVKASAQDAGSVPLPTDPFSVGTRVVGGQSFHVTIRTPLPHMHVELQDDMGTTLDDAAVARDARFVTLSAPAVTSVQTYYLAGTFVRATGEETLVRSVRIFPR